MKKIDTFGIYLIASFVAFGNAYKTFFTDYHFMYWSWVVVGIGCFIIGLVKLLKR